MTKILTNKSSTNIDYPICRPSLDLDFTQEVLDPRITFSRGSIGTRVNRNRLIETISANQPRFDYDPVTGECKGLLIEESRSNSLLYSADTSNAAWGGKSTVIIGSTITAPDGTNTAYKVIENTSNVIHNTNQSVGTISGTYTVSCFVKAGERYRGYIQIFGAGGNVRAAFNLKTGTITGGSGTNTITPYPNGWYRVTSTGTFTSATAACYLVIYNDNGVGTYTGDGSSGLYFWGAQVEAGAFPTSYIPTTASTVTRTADLASITGTNFSSWYNSSEGTLYASAAPSTNAAYSGYIYSLGTDFNNSILFYRQSDYQPVFRMRSNSRDEYNKVYGAVGFGQIWRNAITLKSAFSLKTNDFNTCVSGNFNSIFSRGLSGTLPTFTGPLYLGNLGNASGFLNGTISRLTYYPRRLKDNQLQYLTQ